MDNYRFAIFTDVGQKKFYPLLTYMVGVASGGRYMKIMAREAQQIKTIADGKPNEYPALFPQEK